VEIDRRLLPGEQPDAAPEQLGAWLRERADPRVQFTCSAPWLICPALAPMGSEDLIRQLGQAIDSLIGRHSVHAVPYGTDASSLAEAGIPSVVFGPGSIDQAHTCDEWIDLAQVEQASEILYRLACAG
jgi:acetylornithine deacetylase